MGHSPAKLEPRERTTKNTNDTKKGKGTTADCANFADTENCWVLIRAISDIRGLCAQKFAQAAMKFSVCSSDWTDETDWHGSVAVQLRIVS
jgi:hypothetical protein